MQKRLGALMIALSIALPAAPATAQVPFQLPLLSLSGEGTVRAKPDMAVITLGVVSEADAAKDALSANTESMNRILASLKEGGLESRDLQTSGFSVDPVYSQPPRDYDGSQPFRPEIVGYRVSNNITVRVRDLEEVGPILDRVVTLGATTISGPSFTVAEPADLEDQARRAAMRDALRKAELYADAADVILGPIYRIDEGYTRAPQPIAKDMVMRMEAAAPQSAVPIEAGELTFEAQVTVSWALGPLGGRGPDHRHQ
jgi:uncharacterized protein YggE